MVFLQFFVYGILGYTKVWFVRDFYIYIFTELNDSRNIGTAAKPV
jgi:hypothetical protein